MTEDELLTAVTSGTKKQPGLCRLLGVRYYHPYNSERCVPGFPDLVLVGSAGIAFRELKSDTGVMRPEQRVWRDDLCAVGIDWGLWRPRDLASGRIRAELAALMGTEVSEPSVGTKLVRENYARRRARGRVLFLSVGTTGATLKTRARVSGRFPARYQHSG